MIKNTPLLTFVLIGIIALLLLSNLKACSDRKDTEKENLALQSALADTVKHFVNKHGEEVAQIQTINMERAKDFTKLKTKDEEIIKLQERVKDYEKKLKKAGSSVTNTVTETVLDTVTQTEVVIVADTLYPVYKSMIKNKWIELDITAAYDSTTTKLRTHDEYSTIVGYDKKKKKAFTDIISSSPYTSIKTTRTFQTTLPKQKAWNISIGGGWGVDQHLNTGFHLGIYAGKTILRL